jgi:cytochrome c556
MHKFVFKFFLSSAIFLLSISTYAQDRKIEQAIKHRQAAFTLMSTYVSRLLQTVENSRPFNSKQIVADARTIELLSRLAWEGFVPGSEKGVTRAKEDIWLEEEQFKKLAAELETRASAVAKAAESGDLVKLKSIFANMRDTCSACHKAFRKD